MNRTAKGLLVVGLVSACVLVQAQTFVGQLPRDWRCNSMPNDLYGPGVVYKTEGESSVPQYVANLNDLKLEGYKLLKGSATLGKVSQSIAAGGMVKAGLLEKVFKLAKGAVGIEAQTRENYDVEYDLSGWYLLDEKSIDAASGWIRSNAKDMRPSSAYWLIRDSLQATRITYRVSTGLMGRLGAEADIAAKLSATVSAAGEKGSHYVLDRSLPKPMWVCHVALRMTLDPKFTAQHRWTKPDVAPLELPEIVP